MVRANDLNMGEAFKKIEEIENRIKELSNFYHNHLKRLHGESAETTGRKE